MFRRRHRGRRHSFRRGRSHHSRRRHSRHRRRVFITGQRF